MYDAINVKFSEVRRYFETRGKEDRLFNVPLQVWSLGLKQSFILI